MRRNQQPKLMQGGLRFNAPTVLHPHTVTSSEAMSRYDEVTSLNASHNVCGSTGFGSDAELLVHKKEHSVKSKISPVSLQCAYCNENCKSRLCLENHMKTHQITNTKGKHKCNICDKIFGTVVILAEHKLSHCKIISGNTCTQCKSFITDEQTFYFHQLQHSSTLNKSSNQITLPVNCIICCQTLQTDIEISLHSNFHLQKIQSEFLCRGCNKIFDKRTGVTVTEFKNVSDCLQLSWCFDCKSIPSNPVPLSDNMEKIEGQLYMSTTTSVEQESGKELLSTQIVDEYNDECHLCGNKYATKFDLQLHVIEHSFYGTGQFSCYICSSVFTSAKTLLSHMINHKPEQKPYECPTCKKGFFFQSELDNHNYEHILSSPPFTTQMVMVLGDITDTVSEDIKQDLTKNSLYDNTTHSQIYRLNKTMKAYERPKEPAKSKPYKCSKWTDKYKKT